MFHKKKEEHKKAIKAAIWAAVDEGDGRWGKVINLMIFFLILISLITLPIEFINDLGWFGPVAEGIEIFITAVFTIEYIIRIYSAPNRLRYIFSWWGIIDLLSILPYYLYRFHTQIFRLARIGRIVRILKIAQMKSSESLEKSVKSASEKKLELMPGEQIEHVVFQHPIFFLINLVLPLILGIVGLLIILYGTTFHKFQEAAITTGIVFFFLMLLFLYKAWLDYHYDVMYLTNHRIIFQNKHIFGHSNHHVEYREITNIRPTHTGLWSFLLGYGSICIDTASDVSVIEHKHAKKHEQVANKINQRCQHHKSTGHHLGGHAGAQTATQEPSHEQLHSYSHVPHHSSNPQSQARPSTQPQVQPYHPAPPPASNPPPSSTPPGNPPQQPPQGSGDPSNPYSTHLPPPVE